MFHEIIPDFRGKQREKKAAFKVSYHIDKDTDVDFDKCLRADPTMNEPERCKKSYKLSCLAQRIPPLWQVPIFRVRSCFECCVRFWMNSSGLSENESFWVRAHKSHAEYMFADRFTDWRFTESILGHSEGEILLGQMSIPFLADVAVFPKGNYANRSTKKVSIIQTRRNFSKLNRPLVLVAGCADGVSELLEWMISNVVEYNVTLFTRDDERNWKERTCFMEKICEFTKYFKC